MSFVADRVFKQLDNHINDLVTDGEGPIRKILHKMIHKSETCGLGGDKDVPVSCLTGRLTLPPRYSSASVMIGSVS